MLVVPGKEWWFDDTEKLIRVQFRGDRVHHFSEEDTHLCPIWYCRHFQHYVSAEPKGKIKLIIT